MNLAVEPFLENLNALYDETHEQPAENWLESSYEQLIDYVISTHHGYLNLALPELGDFVTKILRVHGKNHPELTHVHRVFNQLRSELEQHLIEEEESIFPKIKAYEQNRSSVQLDALLTDIDILESEHDTSGNLLKELRRLTNDYHIPEDACKTFTLTYLKLQELESDLFQHIHLENNILFQKIAEEKSA